MSISKKREIKIPFEQKMPETKIGNLNVRSRSYLIVFLSFTKYLMLNSYLKLEITKYQFNQKPRWFNFDKRSCENIGSKCKISLEFNLGTPKNGTIYF